MQTIDLVSESTNPTTTTATYSTVGTSSNAVSSSSSNTTLIPEITDLVIQFVEALLYAILYGANK